MKSEYPQWVVLQTTVRKMILNHEYHLQEFAFGQIKTQYFVLYYYFNKIKHLLKK